jgi:hypothetical protein
MMSLGNATPPPPPIRPTTTQALVTFFGGLLLAGGSCAGFLTTLNFNGGSDSVNTAFAIGFILSLVVAGVGVVLVIVRVVRLSVRRRAEQQGTPGPR